MRDKSQFGLWKHFPPDANFATAAVIPVNTVPKGFCGVLGTPKMPRIGGKFPPLIFAPPLFSITFALCSSSNRFLIPPAPCLEESPQAGTFRPPSLSACDQDRSRRNRFLSGRHPCRGHSSRVYHGRLVSSSTAPTGGHGRRASVGGFLLRPVRASLPRRSRPGSERAHKQPGDVVVLACLAHKGIHSRR
jgi:hypothetical protein